MRGNPTFLGMDENWAKFVLTYFDWPGCDKALTSSKKHSYVIDRPQYGGLGDLAHHASASVKLWQWHCVPYWLHWSEGALSCEHSTAERSSPMEFRERLQRSVASVRNYLCKNGSSSAISLICFLSFFLAKQKISLSLFLSIFCLSFKHQHQH